MIRINPEGFRNPSSEEGGNEREAREKINTTRTFQELLGALGSMDGLQGSRWYGKEELIIGVTNAMTNAHIWKLDTFENTLNIYLDNITRAAGLRKKVEQLAQEIFRSRQIEERDEEDEE